MLYFFDESGTDLQNSPCEVLTAISISEEHLRVFIEKTTELKRSVLAMTTLHEWEPKGNVLLKRKKFRLANQLPPLKQKERYDLLRSLYKKNNFNITPTKQELTAIGQASLSYVDCLLDMCSEIGIKVFSAVVPKTAVRTTGSDLRKDYSYLFQRIYYHLISVSSHEKGIIVFDEVDKAIAKRLISQMRRYFFQTKKGVERSSRIIPEPFFVHSDLTTATQLADVMAYIINWGYRKFVKEKLGSRLLLLSQEDTFKTDEDTRKELIPFADKVYKLQYRCARPDHKGQNRVHCSIFHIKDLTTRFEKKGFDPDEI